MTYSDDHPAYAASSGQPYSHVILVRRMEDVTPRAGQAIYVRGNSGFTDNAGVELSIENSGKLLRIEFAHFGGCLGEEAVRPWMKATIDLTAAQCPGSGRPGSGSVTSSRSGP